MMADAKGDERFRQALLQNLFCSLRPKDEDWEDTIRWKVIMTNL